MSLYWNESDKILKNKLSRYIKNCKKINKDVKIIITCRGAEWHEVFKKELEDIPILDQINA